MAKIIITESKLVEVITKLMEADEYEVEIDDLSDKSDDMVDVIHDMDDTVDDNDGRVGYIRQLTAELLDYLRTLNSELEGQVEIPDSIEMMSKIMNRTERKRYYMSKFRL